MFCFILAPSDSRKLKEPNREKRKKLGTWKINMMLQQKMQPAFKGGKKQFLANN